MNKQEEQAQRTRLNAHLEAMLGLREEIAKEMQGIAKDERGAAHIDLKPESADRVMNMEDYTRAVYTSPESGERYEITFRKLEL